MYHVVDLSLQGVHFTGCLDRDETSEISIHGSSRDLSESTDLSCQISGHRVDGQAGRSQFVIASTR